MDPLTILNELREVTIHKQNILNQYRKVAQSIEQLQATVKFQNTSHIINFNQSNEKLPTQSGINQSISVLESALQTLRSEQSILRDKKNTLQSERMNISLASQKLQVDAMEMSEVRSLLIEKVHKNQWKRVQEKEEENESYLVNGNISSILSRLQGENEQKENEINQLEQSIYTQKKATHEAYSTYQQLMLAIEQKKKNISQLKKQAASLDWKFLSQVEERNRLKGRQKQLAQKTEQTNSWENKIQKMKEVREVLTETLEKWVQSHSDYLQGYMTAKKIASD